MALRHDGPEMYRDTISCPTKKTTILWRLRAVLTADRRCGGQVAVIDRSLGPGDRYSGLAAEHYSK
jgi:hypothetical protein